MDYGVPGHLPFTRLKPKDTRAERAGSTKAVGENVVRPGDEKPVIDPLVKAAENSVEELRSFFEYQAVCCGVISQSSGGGSSIKITLHN